MCDRIAILEIHEYIDEEGASPFGDWFSDLDANTAARITMGVIRMEMGNLSAAKGVGAGVLEYRMDFGPGYRIYFGRDGAKVIILLAGGTKKHQQRDIRTAHAHWADYKRRKNLTR
ncbi:type II toxin-antitoxin system RelE/ParE family toxin [Comamonadaceae bacterium G21597-S1]|nr:type II toxin-antitoxin system RelE/ParE family toxin [Comamonadaceae bacterium G21597-S1]